MKNLKKNAKDNYTLFQDFIDTYRYPDGTLNKIAILISTLALALFITLAHFTVTGIKSLKSIQTVSASELSVDQIEEYITNSYLDAISDYTHGEINQEAAKQKILSMLANYIESSNGFTTQQNEALKEIMGEFLSNSTVYTDVEKNTFEIKTLSTLIEKKFTENQHYADELKQFLENEIIANTNISESHYSELNEQIENLQAYTDNRMAENSSNLNSMINELRRTYINSLGASDYEADGKYDKGNYAIYNEHLYISLVDDNTSSPEHKDTWQLADLETIISQLEKNTYEEMNRLYEDLRTSTDENLAYVYNTLNDSLTQQGVELNHAIAQQGDELNQAITNQGDELNQAIANQGDELNQAITNQGNTFNESLAQQSNSQSQANDNLQAQIDAINERISDSDKFFEFGYDSRTGSYGYYVNGQFKPW